MNWYDALDVLSLQDLHKRIIPMISGRLRSVEEVRELSETYIAFLKGLKSAQERHIDEARKLGDKYREYCKVAEETMDCVRAPRALTAP